MTLLDGKAVSAQIRAEIAVRAQRYREAHGRRPALLVVQFGSDPASEIYIRNKVKACEETGIRSYCFPKPADTGWNEARAFVYATSRIGEMDGVLIQLPLPPQLDARLLLRELPPEKDVDGFTQASVAALALSGEGFVPCTPLGIMELFKRYEIPVSGKHAVVIGRSNIVGRPMARLLLGADATVTVCHSKSQDLKEICRSADILIAATGRPKLVTADMVKEGAVVVDVGMDRDENGKLCGDVDFESVKERASFITPVPGGVGPMTVAMLLSNTMRAAEERAK